MPSEQANALRHPRETFSKKERLGGWHAFLHVLEQGKRFTSGPVKLFVVERELSEANDSPLRTGFSTPKKIFTLAVDRNRVRRWMREIYRKEKYQVRTAAGSNKKKFDCVFITYDPHATWESVREEMTKLVARLAEFIRMHP